VLNNGTAPLPVRRHGIVVAFALVDDDLYDQLNREGDWHISRGYVQREWKRAGTRGRRYLHRVVMGFGPLGLVLAESLLIDHINHDLLDNRRANLRVVRPKGNQQNRRGANRGSTSSFRGVCFDRQTSRWRAQVTIGYVNHTLGRFDTEEKAAEVAALFRREQMPFSVERPT
jgi:hypothetical protein